MKKRSLEPELIDLGSNYYSLEEYNGCLYQLGKIGKYLGTDNAMIKIFENLPFQFDSVLDVGCGGGYFSAQLAQKFSDKKIVGIDICKDAINYATTKNARLNNLDFQIRQNPELSEPDKSYDIVTTTLVLHHLSDTEIINFLKQAKRVARKAIIINDLHRHWLAYYGACVIMPLFFNNRLTKYDSLLSIKKSFTFKELKCYLEQAELEHYKINWYWPFRWIIKVIL